MVITEYTGVFTHVDDDGNEIRLYPEIKTDESLSVSGKAADSAAVGDKINIVSDTLTSRSNNVASLEEGSTTGDAELIDIRVGADGKTYESAGDAVRSQIDDLNSEIDELNISVFGTKEKDIELGATLTTYDNFTFDIPEAITNIYGFRAPIFAGLIIRKVFAKTSLISDGTITAKILDMDLNVLASKEIFGNSNNTEYEFIFNQDIVIPDKCGYIEIYSEQGMISGCGTKLATNENILDFIDEDLNTHRMFYYHDGNEWIAKDINEMININHIFIPFKLFGNSGRVDKISNLENEVALLKEKLTNLSNIKLVDSDGNKYTLSIGTDEKVNVTKI